ncbi:MAG: amino acid ABC transporter substrate-binding protein [Desulfobacteraceae bacterium]|nr:amino acid ABC transporter substrate-binding protein [Desulfobacteraceae bacterium]
MNKILSIILFILLIFSTSSVHSKPKSLAIISDDNFPPFSFLENGEPVGIDIDIIQELGKRLGIEMKVRLFPWKRLIMMTKNGICDGSMSLFRTPERELFALYTAPVHYSTFVIFVKKGNEFNFSKLSDLYGKSLSKQSGFSISREFDKAEKDKKIRVSDVFYIEDSMKRTIREMHDGFVANKDVTLYLLKTDQTVKDYRNQFSILKKPIKSKRSAYFVLSKGSKLKNKIQLQKDITKTLRSMEMDGTYQRIANKYLK